MNLFYCRFCRAAPAGERCKDPSECAYTERGACADLATCIGCGCTDDEACVDPEGSGATCCWLRLERAAGLGVCSCCAEDLDRWDAGDRTQCGVPLDPDDVEVIELLRRRA